MSVKDSVGFERICRKCASDIVKLGTKDSKGNDLYQCIHCGYTGNLNQMRVNLVDSFIDKFSKSVSS